MAVDIFDTRIMTQMIEEGHNTKHVWLRDRYFTNRPTFTAKKIDFDVVGRGGRRMTAARKLLAGKPRFSELAR